MSLPQRQRGWVGLVVLLLALAIVALLVHTALKQYGVFQDPAARPAAAPGASEADQAAVVTPRSALERARGVESMVKEQAIEQEKRIDAAIPR